MALGEKYPYSPVEACKPAKQNKGKGKCQFGADSVEKLALAPLGKVCKTAGQPECRSAGSWVTMAAMDQSKFGLDPLPKKTRKEVFLEEMNEVVPWADPVSLLQPHAREAHQALGGRLPFALETMLGIHRLQLWWNLSDPAMQEELHERPLYRRLAGLEGAARVPAETTTSFGFADCWSKHNLAPQVLASINAALARQGLPRPLRRGRWPSGSASGFSGCT